MSGAAGAACAAWVQPAAAKHSAVIIVRSARSAATPYQRREWRMLSATGNERMDASLTGPRSSLEIRQAM